MYVRWGHRTLLADVDPQGTARNWRANGSDRDAGGKAFPSVVGTETAEDVREVTGEDVAGAFDVVVIDGPPGMSSDGPGVVTVEALKAADLVLIPVRPSGADLWATSPISELVKVRRDATGEDETPAAEFVVTQADARTNVADEITGSLQSLALPVLDARTGYRVAYARALERKRGCPSWTCEAGTRPPLKSTPDSMPEDDANDSSQESGTGSDLPDRVRGRRFPTSTA